jgi:hypothetical protein
LSRGDDTADRVDNLREAQAQQALAPLLQINNDTGFTLQRQALVETLQAVVARLPEAQVQPALATLLQQMGKTTTSYEFLAAALKAVVARLPEAQVQPALATLLQQISEATWSN